MPPPPPPSNSYLIKIEDSDDESTDESPQPSPMSESSSKKKKKRKSKRKKRKSKRVGFKTVSIMEFERCLGREVVPGDGGWPLGMKLQYCAKQDEINIDRYEDLRRNRLNERWDTLPDEVKSPEKPKTLETRQWDYRYKQKNPLFRTLTEEERMHALVGHAEKISSDGKRPTLSRLKERNFVEHYNEDFTQLDVQKIQHELEELRVTRGGEGTLGCTCRKLRVYIPPPNAGKKAAHKRLAVKRVLEELDKRDARPEENLSREELERLLHDIVEKEPCCGPECPCASNGIECQQETCSCWQISHQGDVKKTELTNTYISTEEAIGRCGNQYGMVAYDPFSINEYRNHLLCSEVTSMVSNDD